jgi:glutamine cyclotransferase
LKLITSTNSRKGIKACLINVKKLLTNILAGLIVLSCVHEKRSNGGLDYIIPYTIIKELPHNEKAFTQGLVMSGERLFESTGRDSSCIAEVNQATGEHDIKVKLDKKYFGEGITILNDKVYQLTWKHKIGFIYDLSTFKKAGEFGYDFQGWGITTDQTHLIISDGTDKIHYLDTLNFEEDKVLFVKENNAKVRYLNELEFIDGYIYANQWGNNYIFKIDPDSGEVVGKLDLSPVVDDIKRLDSNANVLNGIAYNKQTDYIIITGKLWPKAYIIQLNQKLVKKLK